MVEAVACEPVSVCVFPVFRENTGISGRNERRNHHLPAQNGCRINRLRSEFPTWRNRELSEHVQGSDQGDLGLMGARTGRLGLEVNMITAVRVFAGLLAFVVLSPPQPALARADCGLIRDSDKRQECYAVRDRGSARCNPIRNSDDRRLC